MNKKINKMYLRAKKNDGAKIEVSEDIFAE
jgi:hypothetical protein